MPYELFEMRNALMEVRPVSEQVCEPLSPAAWLMRALGYCDAAEAALAVGNFQAHAQLLELARQCVRIARGFLAAQPGGEDVLFGFEEGGLKP